MIVHRGSTGTLGDGMVFVLPIEEAIRIGTGVRGEAALRPPVEPEPDDGT